jgi:hypothetical protein
MPYTIHGDRIDTVADYLAAAFDPHAVDGLISMDALADIRHVASLLPGAITDFFGFECPLGSDRQEADFLVCCRVRHGSREILSGPVAGWDPFSRFQQEPIWRSIRKFANEWAEPSSPLYSAIHNLWIEFDIDDTLPSVPAPNVFIGVDHLRTFSPSAAQQRSSAQYAWLTDLALPILRGEATTPAVRRQLTRIVALLPPAAQVFQVGLMLARKFQGVRLCMRGIAIGQIAGYLSALEWDGDSIELECLLAWLEERVDRIDLDLDMTDHVLPKIGLECYLGASESRVCAFLDHLISCQLCTAPKAAAVAMWTGIADEDQTPEIWPGNLAEAARSSGAGFRSAFVRRLHHVKVDFHAVAPLQAKAYLGVHHKWLAREMNREDIGS